MMCTKSAQVNFHFYPLLQRLYLDHDIISFLLTLKNLKKILSKVLNTFEKILWKMELP